MRLLTHNHLACIRKHCPKTYPLTLEAETVEQEDTDCNAAFIAHTMLHIDYPVLYNTAHALGLSAGLPPPEAKMPDFVALAAKAMKGEMDDDDEEGEEDGGEGEQGAGEDSKQQATTGDADMAAGGTSDAELLATLHTLLMDTHVTEGELICEGCKRHYKIQQGIPNMRLNEDEV